MEESKKSECECAELILALDISITQTHFWHLQTSSYAEHKALDGYYSAIIGFTDKFAEVYIGHYDKFELPNEASLSLENYESKEQMLTYFTNLTKLVDKHYDHQEYGDLKNILDEINACLNSTMYLIKQLS